jgi:hypothetical protein
MKRILVLAAGALILTGCAALSGGITYNDPFQSTSERRLSVRVENTNGFDMSVVALAPGRRYQLGQVQGRTIRQFSIPWSQHQEVRFQIEPVAGRRHTTQALPVGPGEWIWLQITEPINRSVVRR